MTPRLVGETLGTALLVLFGVGAVSVNESVIAGAAGLLIITILLSWIFRGGHFNPWVTLACAIRGTVSWSTAGILVAAQLLGGIIGGLFLYLFLTGRPYSVPRARVAPVAGELISALLAEMLAVFLLACVVFALERSDQLGLGMGLSYAIGTITLYGITGASMNLARTLGGNVTVQLGGASPQWNLLWLFVVSGVLGAALAGLLYPLFKAQEE